MEKRLDHITEQIEVAERFIPPSPARLLPYLATLSAAGIPHEVEAWGRGGWHIVVPEEAGDRAREELAAYERDNRDWPRQPSDRTGLPLPQTGWEFFAAAAVGAGLIVFFLRLGSVRSGSIYQTAGSLDTERILDGEWWRTVTALTLHADATHVMANAVCACVFGLALSQLLGSGIAWLLILLSGVFGNGAETLLAGPGRLAIGASTATFGALGALGTLQTLRSWNGWRDARSVFSRTWLPIAASAVLLGWLGSGPRADIVGHVLGFGCGIVLALLASPLLQRSVGWFWHCLAGISAAALVAYAWHLALAAAGG